MAEKPIPQALYGCHFCGDEYSHPADELFWSEKYKAWVCDSCWDDRDGHRDHDNNTYCKYGISLEKEINNRAKNISIIFSKNIDEILVDTPVLILLVDKTIHTSIKRQSTFICDNESEIYYYFEITNVIDVETQESCYIDCEKVIGFTTIPEIIL